MNQMTLSTAKPNVRSSWHECYSTSYTNLLSTLYRGGAAFTRTIFDRSMHGFSGIKRFTTLSACSSTTGITNQSRTGTRNKIFVTLSTNRMGNNYGKRVLVIEFGMRSPKLLFCDSMTRRTESNQILQLICLSIIIKKSKWHQMMDGQILCLFAAMLALMVISFSRSGALFTPIGTSITSMTAAPFGIFIPTQYTSNTTPLLKTFTSTKIPIDVYSTQHAFKNRTAISAGQLFTLFSSIITSGFRFPLTKTMMVTKRMFRPFYLRGGTFNLFSALKTVCHSHSKYYSTSGLLWKGILYG